MRLFSSLSRRLEELPAPPGPIGMYVCGPTVYARAHIGNARPFVIFAWLRNWLRERDYDVTFVHNITDVDDKILAADGPSAEVARQATEWYLEDIGDLGLGLPDRLPRATETIPEIIAMIERLTASGHAYEVDGDVYFRVSSDPDYGQLSGQRPEEVAEQEPNPRKEDPRDFALWKANKPGEDLVWKSPWGPGRPGWHIECSAMAEKFLGPRFELHGSGRDIVFPHNENELAQSRALGSEFAHIWMHNGMLRFTGEKMSKSVGNVTDDPRGDRHLGPRDAAPLLHDGALVEADRLLRGDAGAGRARRSRRCRNSCAKAAEAETTGTISSVRSRTTSTLRRRCAPARLAVGRRLIVRRGLAIFGLGSLAGEERCARSARQRGDRAREQRAERARLRGGRPPAGRDRGARLGGSGRRTRASGSSEGREPDLVYGRRAVREALRGPREVLEVHATERAIAAEPWLRDTPGLRVRVEPDRALTALAGTSDHQGVVARCAPFRYADAHELAAADRPLLVCLDQVTDPRNLGAVCRSAEVPVRPGSFCRLTTRRASLRPSAAHRRAPSSTFRSRSCRTWRGTSAR